MFIVVIVIVLGYIGIQCSENKLSLSLQPDLNLLYLANDDSVFHIDYLAPTACQAGDAYLKFPGINLSPNFSCIQLHSI